MSTTLFDFMSIQRLVKYAIFARVLLFQQTL